jgi:hypothetical protein
MLGILVIELGSISRPVTETEFVLREQEALRAGRPDTSCLVAEHWDRKNLTSGI